jgi:hypothetical protein
MIVVTGALSPALKPGEFDLAGRRVAVRAAAYAGEAGPPSFRFDPLDLRFVERRSEGSVAAGPADSEIWREALARLPPGAVAVEGCSAAEAVRGAYRAAAEGAGCAGRGVYLIDPEPEGLPQTGDRSIVVIVSWRPGPLPSILAAAARAGFASGLALPVIPGWTGEAAFWEPLLDAASAAGAVFVAALSPACDGDARRLMVEARSADDPAAADRFFEQVHHGDWGPKLPGLLADVRAACSRRNLATLPPRAVGAGEPAVNAAAAAYLELRAREAEADEHRQALLHAAVRWIDESGRDLAGVVREGNFRKVFPFGSEVAAEAEAALGGVR